jgi:pentapeptide MXKDX repeat protein
MPTQCRQQLLSHHTEVYTMANKKAAWTVMVYLAGDNNLSTECVFALTEMRKVAANGQVNVIAQFDPQDAYLPTHRYEIHRKNENGTLVDDIFDEARFSKKTGEVHFRNESKAANSLASARLQDGRKARRALSHLGKGSQLGSPIPEDDVITDDTDTGSPIPLYNFLSYCVQEYPAHHYMVVLSGHSGGTERDYLMKDESSAGSLTFNELKQVFQQLRTDLKGQTIDIIGMDSCLMSMGEICYELRGMAQIVVGCESYSPASGWPYRQILERLQNEFAVAELPKGKSVQVEVAKALVEEYVNYYSDYWLGGMSVAQSALDLGEVEKLRKVVDKLADTLERELKKEEKKKGHAKAHPFQDALVLAHWEAQSYNGEMFVDLYDFCDCLERRNRSGPIAKRCREVKSFISTKFVLRSCYSGAAYQYSNGVSLYFPWSQVAKSYENLDFVKNSTGSGWFAFLNTYVQLTRRTPRGVSNKSRLSEANVSQSQSVRMTSDRMTSDRMTSDRMTSDRMTSDRMTSDRMTSDRMTSDRSGNPIHSMRNPPLIFLPSECIREHQSVLVGQERFFKDDSRKTK